MSNKSKVLVFGGGVGGLSVAQELTEAARANRFEVTVVEPRNESFGGKARSDSVDGSPPAAAQFPGEHGFRFFPTFYRHVTDTMARIPSGTGKLGRVSVADHLVPTRRRMLARRGAAPLELPGAPNLAEPQSLMNFLQAIGGTGIQPWEYAFFASRLLDLASTPKAQRLANHQRQSWWDFVRSGVLPHSPAYEHYLAGGLTRTLVAAKPGEINAKTGGDVLLRMLVDSGVQLGLDSGLAPGLRAATDRILDGPTTAVWIQPWLDELKRRGVRFELGTLDALQFDAIQGRVQGATVLQAGQPVPMAADFYVCALPVEKMAGVLQKSPAVEAAGQNLEPIRTVLSGDVRFMVGMQFFLDRPLAGLPADMGHAIYADSAWALTGICQSHFWRPPHDNLGGFGAGTVRTVWSTILSDWDSLHPLAGGKAAAACSRAELRAKTIEQLQEGLNGDGVTRFDAATVLSHYLDASLTPGPEAGGSAQNVQPLLVNKPDRWKHRPEPAPQGVPNLLLAADYVRTNTDLATMEAANEAARHAVNAILAQAGGGPPCDIFDLYFPEVLGPQAAAIVQAMQAFRAQLLPLLP